MTITEILLEVALNTITLILLFNAIAKFEDVKYSFLLFVVVYCSTVNYNISQALFADYDSGLRPVCGDITQVNATLGMALRQVIDMVSCVKWDRLFYANMYSH